MNDYITHEISEEYFNRCKNTAREIFNFLKIIDCDSELVEFVNSINGIDYFDNYRIYRHFNTRVVMLYLIDFVSCYSAMGYKFNKMSKEALCACMIISYIIDEEFCIKYEYLSTIYNDTFEAAIDNLHTIESMCLTDSEHKYVFNFINIFNAVEDNTRKQRYYELLLQFSNLIATPDDSLSSQQSEYLNKLSEIANERKEVIEESNNIILNPIKKLESLIGLTPVKEEIKRLSNFIKIQRLRLYEGLSTTPISYHCVFTGNPGTGKTTVARIIASIYRELGILKKGHLIETDRSGLVGEYVGHTAVKTNKIIDSALDGVLFIDEAYSLVNTSGNDFGTEAIATLLKRMEDDRERLVVILAGYGNEMKTFIDSNPGLQSRFNRYIHFEDYTAEDLVNIYQSNVNRHEYILPIKSLNVLRSTIETAVSNKDKNFGNARYIRNLFEKTLENQATRLASQSSITKTNLQEIRPEDIPTN